MYKNYIDLLYHILLECKYIKSVLTSEVSKEDFLADETLKRAIVRSLEVIGEATKKIPADIKLKWKDISWKSIAGMRDRLIHDYMGINYYIVWDVASNIIPNLSEQIEFVISQEQYNQQ